MWRALPVVVALMILGVFVATVIVIAVEAGTSTAILAATVFIAGAAFGLWGAAMAVKETDGGMPPTHRSEAK